MDAIRKKMQSLKSETDVLMATIARFEGDTKESLTRFLYTKPWFVVTSLSLSSRTQWSVAIVHIVIWMWFACVRKLKSSPSMAFRHTS